MPSNQVTTVADRMRSRSRCVCPILRSLDEDVAPGSSVALHMFANQSRGLFFQAIGQSVYRTPLPALEQQLPMFDYFALQARCSSGSVAEVMACLRQADTSVLPWAQDIVTNKFTGARLTIWDLFRSSSRPVLREDANTQTSSPRVLSSLRSLFRRLGCAQKYRGNYRQDGGVCQTLRAWHVGGGDNLVPMSSNVGPISRMYSSPFLSVVICTRNSVHAKDVLCSHVCMEHYTFIPRPSDMRTDRSHRWSLYFCREEGVCQTKLTSSAACQRGADVRSFGLTSTCK
ncbi:hypothetical protein C8Q76DRAFT_220029 [Earliella scabrosa]|nr:hypothetical protein C8Q76DRAFT_220029 [Earliella scabrosa]